MNYRFKEYRSFPLRDESLIRSDDGGEFFRNIGSLEDVKVFAIGNFVLGVDFSHQMVVKNLLLEEVFQQRSQNGIDHQFLVFVHTDTFSFSKSGYNCVYDLDVEENAIVVDSLSEVLLEDSPKVLEEVLQTMVSLAWVDLFWL